MSSSSDPQPGFSPKPKQVECEGDGSPSSSKQPDSPSIVGECGPGKPPEKPKPSPGSKGGGIVKFD